MLVHPLACKKMRDPHLILWLPLLLFLGTFLLCTPRLAASAAADASTAKIELEQRLDHFNAWLWNMSPVNQKIAIRSSQWGNGVFLRAPEENPLEPREKVINVGDVVLEIPEHFTFCDESLKKRGLQLKGNPYGPALLKAGVSETERVALTLLTEFLIGEASEVSPWMAVVPGISELLPPHLWSKEVQEMVEPRSLAGVIKERSRQLIQDYIALAAHSSRILHTLESFVTQVADKAYLSGVLNSQATDLGRVSGGDVGGSFIFKGSTPASGLTYFTPERVLWATSLVDSRAWNMNGKQWLAPAADMFNHQPDLEDLSYDYKATMSTNYRSDKFFRFHRIETSTKATADSSGGAIKFAKALSDRAVFNRPEATSVRRSYGGEDKITGDHVVTQHSTRTYVQVFESYGDNTNDIYFNYHGFMPTEINKYDCQALELSIQVVKGGSSRSSLFQPLDRHQKAALRLVSTGRGGMMLTHCVHLGELPPALLLVGLVSQLDERQLTPDCVQAALKLPQGSRSLHWAMMKRYKTLKTCLVPNITGGGEVGGAENSQFTPNGHGASFSYATGRAVVLKGLKYSKAAVKSHFQAQFTVSDVERDELILKELESMDSNDIGGEGVASRHAAGGGDTNTPVIRSQKAMALRMRINRKKILRKLLSDLNRAIKKYSTATEKGLAELNHGVNSNPASTVVTEDTGGDL